LTTTTTTTTTIKTAFRNNLHNLRNMSSTSKHSFKEDFRFSVNDYISVSKYVSAKTGLVVTIADVPGPIVDGYLTLATEAHDDDGLPHTLEHLVFMGSEDFPYKGVLDLLANRCLASGTNAWTDTDHTAYTMTTAGSGGFRNLLPIYLDHVLYPTLIPSAYVTEVHHINGEGEDAGVVYSEMQARENSGESRTHLELLREMYPGKCGYKSETGGIMKNLRESCSNQKVMDYHEAFYRPDNLCVIIVGTVNHEEVFESLKEFEEKIASKGSLSPLTRPWTSPVPPLEKSVDKIVEYGADEEDHGMVTVGWRAPKSKDLYPMTALGILLEYLADTAVSPLQKEFVEKHPPMANHVSHSIIENSEGTFYLHFSNVPTERLDEVSNKLMEILKNVAEGEEEDAFDLVRMKNEVKRKITTTLNQFEDDPHEHIAGVIIGYFLYGNESAELEARLNDVTMMRQMESEPASFWRQLVKTLMLDQNKVVIRGKPSKELMEKMGAEEKERVRLQREELGEDGLTNKKEELDEAIEKNEEEPPTELLESVPIPSIDTIQFHPIQQFRNFGENHGANTKLAEFDISTIPTPLQFDLINSSFVSLSAYVNTEGLEPKLRFYLPLYLNLIFETCLSRDDGKTIIPHTQVIADLSRDTVYYGGYMGFEGGSFGPGEFSDLAVISLKVDENKFGVGVNWLKDVIFHAHFTEERVKTVATKLLNEVPTAKRSGSQVLRVLVRNQNFNQRTTHWSSSLMRQHNFLKNLLTDLESEKSQQVLEDLAKLKRAIAHDHDLILHVAADARRLSKILPAEDLPLTKHFIDSWPRNSASSSANGHCRAKDALDCSGLKTVTPTNKCLVEFINSLDPKSMNHLVIGVGSVESAYLISATPAMTKHDHEDLPALMVLIQYLTQLEGPMWRQIRGQGFAYSFSISVNIEHGLLYFSLKKATHLALAFKEAINITKAHIDGDEEFDEVEFEAAKSSLVFEIIDEEKTVSGAAEQSILYYFRGLPNTHSKELLNLISQVEIDDLEEVGRKYLLPVFDAATSRSSTVCHPTKVEDLQKEFQEMKYLLHPLPSLDHEFVASTDFIACGCN